MPSSIATYVPDQKEINAAIEERNSLLISQYLVGVECAKLDLQKNLSSLIQGESDARRDFRVASLCIRHNIDAQSFVEKLPDLETAKDNAKRDLDVAKEAIKNHKSTMTMLESILKTMRP